MKDILFVSGSLGLGHILRDLEIVKNLRKLDSNVKVSWLTDYPATTVLENAREVVLPESMLLDHGNKKLEDESKNHGVNLTRWVMNMRKSWSKNVEVVIKLMKDKKFDLLIGDETYDLAIAFHDNPELKEFPFFMIIDFLGLDSVSKNPLDLFITYKTNKLWSNFITFEPALWDKIIFIGDLQDVPDKKFGLRLPNRRKVAEKYFDFVGYILNFDPKEYQNKNEIRKNLGYGNEKLVICSIGGTSAGKELLQLCKKAYPLIKKEIKNLKLVLVTGPNVQVDYVKSEKGITVVGYLPDLFKHLAAADLCIVTGGGTITLELTALQKPFLFFPLQNHFEQEVAVADRCDRYNAGIKMKFSETTPQDLANAVIKNIDKKVSYSSLPIDGAKKASEIINMFVESNL